MTKRFENVAHKLDNTWVEEELIPLLVTAYGELECGQWMQSVQAAAETLDELPIYEDFDTTIERFRLLLVNRDILSRAEIADFGNLREQRGVCIGVFIRHAIVHGNFELHTLGTDPSPDHPRSLVTEEDEDSYIFGGKLSMRRIPHGKKKVKEWRKPQQPQGRFRGRNQPHESAQTLRALLGTTSISETQGRPRDQAKKDEQPLDKREQIEPPAAMKRTPLPINAAGKVLRWPQDRAQIKTQAGVLHRGPIGGSAVQQPSIPIAQTQDWRGEPQQSRSSNSRYKGKSRWKGKAAQTSYRNASHSHGRDYAPQTIRYGNSTSYQYKSVEAEGYGASPLSDQPSVPPSNQCGAPPSNQYAFPPLRQYGSHQPSTLTAFSSQTLPHTRPEFQQPYRHSGPPATTYISDQQHRGYPPRVQTPAYTPTATRDLRVGASEFRPGASGHGF